MYDWTYWNHSTENEQRLRDAENERLARQLRAQQPTRSIVSAVIAGITRHFDARSQPEKPTAVRLQPRS